MTRFTFKVTMVEQGRDGRERTLEQTAITTAQDELTARREVIRFYGLHEADIISYRIQTIETANA